MAARIAAFDWNKTPLGRMEDWPISLRTTVATVLENRFPMSLLWGPELLHVYNDAYVPVLGSKHPALGHSARIIWPEIWPIVGPQIEGALEGRGAAWNEHLLLPLRRKGFLEESYFTVAFSPVRDDSGTIGGVLITCHETTVQVQDERQLQMLRELGAEGVEADTAEAACRTAAHVLAKNDADIPFALLYLIRPGSTEAELVASLGTDGVDAACPAHLPWRQQGQVWPLAEAREAGAFLVVDDLAARFGRMPGGRWEEPPQRAVVLCLAGAGQAEPYGFLIAGVSPLRPLDERYRRMFRLTVDQIVNSISAARSFEEEHRRVEALAALDRAKTTFFSNVSHEFRTPLTLMLGPAEDLMAGVHGPLAPRQRGQIDLIQRNAKRLHKLVNALLNVTRIEAGRVSTSFEPLELAPLTRELAGSFQAAMERAGLTLTIRCPDLGEPVFVDRDMWEQIVLNLVSNALKFTFEGTIEVALAIEGPCVVLRVADTGVGIAPENLPQLFDRFFRLEGGRARTAEGSGIGLAMVQDMVKVHKGTIEVDTAVGRGTTFVVKLPRGSAHLPADQIVPIAKTAVETSSSKAAAPFIQEALGWFQSPEGESPDAELAALAAQAFPESPTARILIADDNADMRTYLRRILEARFAVEVVGDGEAALAAAAARPPDLVLTDVMMGTTDGFELMRRLRARPQTRTIPVVMVSARTGEEAKVEGLRAGADEYLTKPFSARELLARVDAQLKLARLRARAEHDRERFFALLQQAPVPIVVYEGTDLRLAFQNEAAWTITGGPGTTGKTFLEIFPELAGKPSHQILRQVYDTGQPAIGHALPVRVRGVGPGVKERIFDFIRQPMKDADGRLVGVIGVAFEVTDAVRARREIEQSEARFRTIFEMADVSIWEEDFSRVKVYCEELRATYGGELRQALESDPTLVARALRLMRVRDVNPATLRMFGAKSKEQLFRAIGDTFIPKTMETFREELIALAEGHRVFVSEAPLRTLDGKNIDVVFSLAISAEDHAYERALITITDVSGHKAAEREREARIAEMERAVRFGEMFAGMLGHDLRNPLSAIMTAAELIERRTDSEKIAGPARRVISSAARMARMISQLLDFTRIRLGGGLPLERAHMDLAEVCRAIIEELEPVYACQLTLDTRGDVSGTWDRDRLSQMVSNLAANACQHGTEGFPIDLVLDGTARDRVQLEVRNQGVVPPALLPFVFEPLRQANDTGPRVGPSSGLGLGLYITQQIALAHGGTIYVQSEEATGTRFIVVLPRKAT